MKIVVYGEMCRVEKFIESQGAPMIVSNQSVVQMDRIPIKEGRISLRLCEVDTQCICVGISIKSKKGYIEVVGFVKTENRVV